jgi:hypothetical protein
MYFNVVKTNSHFFPFVKVKANKFGEILSLNSSNTPCPDHHFFLVSNSMKNANNKNITKKIEIKIFKGKRLLLMSKSIKVILIIPKLNK